jgi:hypothetical protein
MKFANATELLTVLATQRFSFSVDHLGAGNRQSAAHRGTGSLPRYFEWSGLSDIGTELTPLRRRKMSAFKGAAVISLDQLLVSKMDMELTHEMQPLAISRNTLTFAPF